MSSIFTYRDKLEKSDSIIVLTGNGWERTKFAVDLFHQKWAPTITMVGSTGSRPAPEMADYAQQHGIPKKNITIEINSRNSQQNAENILMLAKKNGWGKIILVTSPHHQLRAHLTFSKTKKLLGSEVKIINYPPTNYSWFDWIESSRDKNKKIPRFLYIFSEMYRIVKYRLKGDL